MRSARARLLALLAVLLFLFATSGCLGPQRLTRRMDDWVNQNYFDSPWLIGNTVVWGLRAAVLGATWTIDGVLLNVYYFWIRDAWPLGSGVGTRYEHLPIVPPAPK